MPDHPPQAPADSRHLGHVAGSSPKECWRLLVFSGLLLVLVCLALAWSSSPLKEWLDVQKAAASLRAWAQLYGPYLGLAGFTLALVCAVPLSFLTIVTIVAYGPWAGFGIVMSGALLAAAITFQAGKWLGHALVTRLAGPRVNAISQKLAQRGLLAVIAIRLVPVAPFAIVNMVAGASHLRLREMVFGTLLGMLPGTVGMAFFLDYIVEALRRPTLGALPIGLLLIVFLLGGFWGLRLWLRNATSRNVQKTGKR